MAASLDFDTTSSYTLTVEATDTGSLSDTTTVSISVTDVNEAPSFGSTTYSFRVPENSVDGLQWGLLSPLTLTQTTP